MDKTNILLIGVSYCLALCGMILSVGVLGYRDTTDKKEGNERSATRSYEEESITRYNKEEVLNTLGLSYSIVAKMKGTQPPSEEAIKERAQRICEELNKGRKSVELIYEALRRNVSRVMEYVRKREEYDWNDPNVKKELYMAVDNVEKNLRLIEKADNLRKMGDEIEYWTNRARKTIDEIKKYRRPQ